MRHQNPSEGVTVDAVEGDVVLRMSRPRARHVAMVIDATQPREAWLHEAVLSMLVAADRVSVRAEDLHRRLAWSDASALISRELLRSSSSLMVVAQEIADDVLQFSHGRSLTIMVVSPDDPTLLEVRVAAGVGAAGLVGQTLERSGSAAGSAMDHDRAELGTAAGLRVVEVPVGSTKASRPVMAVPIHGGGSQPRGAIVVSRRSDQRLFDAADLAMTEDFARQTSLTLELAESRTYQDWRQQKRESDHSVHALYDSILQRLFSIGMMMQSAGASLGEGQETASVVRTRAQLGQAVEDLNVTIREVRASLQALELRPRVAEPAGHEQEVAALLVHEAAVHAAEVAQTAVDSAADRAAEAASTARAQRSAAVEAAAQQVAARVAEAAAAVSSEADLAALTVAQAAFDAAFLIASTVSPGSERDAALTATLVATAVSAIAIKTAAVTATTRAEVAREAAEAAEAAAVAAADAAKVVELEVMCAAEAVRAVATEAALLMAEQTDADAIAFAATFD